MLKTALIFALSFVASLGCGYFSFCFFRQKKTGVKSKFLPNRKTLGDNKKSTGSSPFLCAVVTLFGVAYGENIAVAVCCCVFVACLTAVGFADDWLKDIKGQNVGLKSSSRIFATALISLLFGIILGIAKQNTIVTLPFVRGGVRLGWAYPVFVCLSTLVFTHGTHNLGKTYGADYPMTFLKLLAVFTTSNLLQNQNNLCCVAVFTGIIAGAIFWTYPPCLLKTGQGDKYFCVATTISACVLTSNEALMWFLMCFELIASISKPVDKLFAKIFNRHIFVKLPLSENLKAMDFSDKKLYLTYTVITAVFCVVGVISVWLLNVNV